MKKKLALIAGLFIGSCMFLISCKMRSAGMTAIKPPYEIEFEKLSRSDYEILGNVTGRGSVTSITLFPIPFGWKRANKDNGVYMFFGSLTGMRDMYINKRAESIANYNAIQSIPDADAIIFPRYHIERSYFLPWYEKSDFIVKAKAIRIKTDTDLTK